MLRNMPCNIIGQILDSKHVFVFSKKTHFPCRKKKMFEKQKMKKRKIWTEYGLKKKANLGQTFDSTAYIYIYAYGCVIEPHFRHFKRA